MEKKELELAESRWKARTKEGESPVSENKSPPDSHPSNVRHVKPGVNPGGPPPKAKYSCATDSEQVERLKNEKNPVEGSEREPETIYLQAVGALWSCGERRSIARYGRARDELHECR